MLSGASPPAMYSAMPSAIAVLPTPGSPISTGLFFVRRESICTLRRISSLLPIIGSMPPEAASCVRSRLYWSSMRVSPCLTAALGGVGGVGFAFGEELPNTASTSVYISFKSQPQHESAAAPPQSG